MSGRSTTLLVLGNEVRQLVRDRRALFAAVVLPALLYPLLFWSQGAIEESSREMLEAREVGVAVDFSALSEDAAGAARAAIAARTPIQVFDVDAGALAAFEADEARDLEPEPARVRRRAAVDDLLSGGGHVLVTGRPHREVLTRTKFRVYFDVKDDDSREAADRVEAALEEHETRLVRERRAALLSADPAAGLDLEPVDVATAKDASGAKLGRLLPLLALIVLLSGGSYAALAVFAGEREAGTLETLLVQPVPAASVVRGKYLAVLAAGLVTLAANLASAVACLQLGLGDFAGLDMNTAGGLDLARLASGVVYLPACALLCALLCLVCGRARTFRQGQVTILPILIVTALPTAVALQPQVEATPLLALVPFTGPALALRDALRGELALLPTAVMILSHIGWTMLLLSRLGTLLDAERVLAGGDDEGSTAQRRASSRHGLRWGFVAVLSLYVLGGELQRWDLKWGLVLTLWVVLPALAWLCARRARGASSTWSEFKLRPPQLSHVAGAALVVPGLAWVIAEWVLPLQMRLLPMPSSAGAGDALVNALETTSTPLLLFLFALSPGVGEELFFRGPLLSSLRRDLTPARAVAWQALFFAAAHASVYRLVPTGLLGLLLGAVTLRARSLWPAILLHAGYNAYQTADQLGRLPAPDHPAWSWAPWLAIPGLALLALPRRDAGAG